MAAGTRMKHSANSIGESGMMRPIVLIVVCSTVASATIHAADKDGFTPIFDGKSLVGWHVVPKKQKAAWSVRDGVLVGSSIGTGSDLIWKDDKLGDFELKLQYRFRTKGNSGIHVRGLLGESKTHRVKGYHADFGHVGIGPQVLGAWDFHGVPRGSNLVSRGQRVVIDEQGRKHFSKIEGAVTPKDVKKGEWNDVHVVARGHRLYFKINGKIASEVIDKERSKRIDRGIIGLQLHGGDRMTIEFKNIRLRRLQTP